MKKFLLVGAFVALLVACTPSTETPGESATAPPDTAKIREVSRARVAALAAGDIDGYLSAYEEEAVWMPPAAGEIVGVAAAKQRLEGALDETSLEPAGIVDEEVVLSPDWVLVRGTYSMARTPKAGGETEEAVGSYMTIWRRQEDGSFKIAYDAWNSDRPGASNDE